MRTITAQNAAMQELLMQVQNQGGFQAPHRPQQSGRRQAEAGSSRRTHVSPQGEAPVERDVGMDTSNYTAAPAGGPPAGDSFPPEYERPQRSVSVFDRIGRAPRNRNQPPPQTTRQQGHEQSQEVQAPPPRNRRERRSQVDWGNRAEAAQRPPRQQADGNDSDGPCRSYELDDDDDNLPFSRELRTFPMPHNFVPPKIPKYEGNGDPEKHLNKYKKQMSLRGASPALKCRAFHLTLGGSAEV